MLVISDPPGEVPLTFGGRRLVGVDRCLSAATDSASEGRPIGAIRSYVRSNMCTTLEHLFERIQAATRTNVRRTALAIFGCRVDDGTRWGRRGSSCQTATEGVRDGSEGDVGAGTRVPGRGLALD